MVSHSSKQQMAVAYLSTEAKYIAFYQAIEKVVWLHLFELKLEWETFSITLKTDNKGSIILAFNLEFHAWIKYISVKIYYVYEIVTRKDVMLEWIKEIKNVVDLLTKFLDSILFKPCLEAIKLGPI